MGGGKLGGEVRRGVAGRSIALFVAPSSSSSRVSFLSLHLGTRISFLGVVSTLLTSKTCCGRSGLQVQRSVSDQWFELYVFWT